MVNSNCKIT